MSSSDSREMFRDIAWPFPGDRFPEQLGAVVMRSVLEGHRPALQVFHFPENDWAIADGIGDFNGDGATTVAHIWHVLDTDPTLLDLAGLPPGSVADRATVGSPWVISPFVWEPGK